MRNLRYCNICGWQGEQFSIFYNERMQQDEEAVCLNCSSEPRQRLLFKYLQENYVGYSKGTSFRSQLLVHALSIIGDPRQFQRRIRSAIAKKAASILPPKLISALRPMRNLLVSRDSARDQKLHEPKKILEFLATYLYTIKHFLCLEIAPYLSPMEKALKGVVYVSIDLNDPHAMFQMDLTNLIFKDFTFDLVVCSHVLEHIEDDLIAIKQIYRLLKKDGVALIQIPIGCYEDPLGKSTIEFGKRRFYGYFRPVNGHVRSYGWDFNERLIKAGFKVNVIHFTDYDSSKLGIEKEAIFECKK